MKNKKKCIKYIGRIKIENSIHVFYVWRSGAYGCTLENAGCVFPAASGFFFYDFFYSAYYGVFIYNV